MNLSSKRTSIIILSVLFVVLVGAGGYLLWRVNQPETIAPEDSEASDPSSSPNCGDRVSSESGKAVGQRCIGKDPYTYECGVWCYLKSNGPDCCKEDPKPTQHIVTYKPNGGTCGGKTANYTHTVTDEKASPAPGCSRSGYKLKNYTLSGTCGGTFSSSTGVCSKVTGAITIQANWEQKKYTVTYKAGNDGSIEGTKVQTVNHGASSSSVTAKPNSGYFFAGWNDGKNTNPRTDKNVTKDITVTANFSLSCGNGVCEADENAQNCPADCPADCGDGYCDSETESVQNCPEDCLAVCGDGYCTHDETSVTCPEDCGPSVVSAVPETGIFDDTKATVITGLLLLFLGFTWRTLGRGMYVSIEFMGKMPRKLSIHLKDVKEDIRMRRKVKEIRKSDKRRRGFEKKVVKE